MKPSVKDIVTCAAAEFGVWEGDIIGRCHRFKYSRPRQIAMFLCRNMSGMSFPKIGRAFGRRDHTSVMHACRVVNELVADETFLAKVVAVAAEATALCRAREAQERIFAQSLHMVPSKPKRHRTMAWRILPAHPKQIMVAVGVSEAA